METKCKSCGKPVLYGQLTKNRCHECYNDYYIEVLKSLHKLPINMTNEYVAKVYDIPKWEIDQHRTEW